MEIEKSHRNEMDLSMKGVVPILVTPFDIQGRVDKHSLESLIDFNIEAGVHGWALPLDLKYSSSAMRSGKW